ncbi:MAG: hypothetical protein OXI53_09590 [Nitrospira sp.]|nr:hypothetical protein [Nitrospira sp.]MDE0405550.1 hypothetical protein [Nitrospira sp.]MDE0487061.1 hypothetical protein [Nitrospira sp.]
MEDDQETTDQEPSIAELLAMPEAAGIEFEPPRMKQGWRKPEKDRVSGQDS